MARFCTNCGTQVEGSFCGNCGAGVGDSAEQQAAPSGPQQASAAAGTAKAGSSTFVKVIIGVVAVVVVLGVISAAGIYWAASKVKSKVEQAAAESGVDLGKLARESSASATSEGGDGCYLLPKETAERIIGFSLVKAEHDPTADSSKLSCRYMADPAELLKRAQAQTDEALRRLKQSGGGSQKGDMAQLEQFTKGLAAGAMGGESGDGTVFTISVRRGGGQTDWAGVSMALKMMGGGEKIQGVGDQALLGPMASMIYVIKGEDFIEIDMRALPNGRVAGVELAKAITAKL